MHQPIIPPRPLVAKTTGFGRAGATFDTGGVVEEVAAAAAVDILLGGGAQSVYRIVIGCASASTNVW
jgi:hypothetical protein